MKGKITIDIQWSDEALEAAEELAQSKNVESSYILNKALELYITPFTEEHDEGSVGEFTYKLNTEVLND